MTAEQALEILLDALKDSALIFLFVFIVHFIISFFEDKLANFLVKKKKAGPLFGSLFGLIPQCGTSVLGADLYIKEYITIGTLGAIFLSCSDEALITIISKGGTTALMSIPLILSKFVIGFIFGMIIDLMFKKQELVIPEGEVVENECHEHHHKNTKLHKYLFHPLLHSLEVFIYVFIINLALGFIIGFVGEDNFSNFLLANKYLTPLFSSVIGLIPNCASSLLISELFISGSLSFGALLSGLLVNAGLGFIILLKNKEYIKKAFILLGICFLISIICGYICCLIFGF